MMEILTAKAIDNPLAFIGIMVAATSLLVAICSLSLTWRLWRKTNRPILTAWIASVAGGDDGIALNILKVEIFREMQRAAFSATNRSRCWPTTSGSQTLLAIWVESRALGKAAL